MMLEGSGGGKREKRQFFHFNTKDAGKEEPSEPIIKAMDPSQGLCAEQACRGRMCYIDHECRWNG